LARAQQTRPACGIRIASSSKSGLDHAIADLKRELGPGDFQHILAFFSSEHDASRLAAALSEAFEGVPLSGCSTAGEIAPGGTMEGGIVLIAFPRQGFRILCDVIEDIDAFGFERASAIVRRLTSQFANGEGAADKERGSLRERVFALMFIDGLSNREEMLVAAIHWAIEDVQLVGGSAGDGLSFRRTALIHDGRAFHHAALLLMIESDFPFRVFKTQNFEATDIKLVVTAADTENRVVHELNAEPAAREYAAAIGLLPDDLGPFSFASYPLVVKVGGDCYCRSIRNMNPDGSLSFFCAIDEGLVFTVARPQELISSTERTLSEVDETLGGIDLVIGFDCVLRRLDAENRQVRHQVDAIYRKYSVVGFHTYGEQFNAMHLNQTLTGIAFGCRDAPR